MPLTRFLTVALLLCAIGAGTGCGGGGGGGGSDAPSNFTVSTSAGANGTIDPSSRTVNAGNTTTFTITPDTGHSIESVSGCDGSLSDNTYTTGSINGNCTVSATFVIDSFEVSTNAGSNGSISPASAEVDHGSSETFTITPDSGFTVGDVGGCGGTLDDDTYTTGSITGPCTVSASFRRPFISGTVSAAGGTAVDSSVNDPNDEFTANDTIASAQPILNPVTLGGYVNEAGKGSEGRSFESGDEFDIFRVNLIEKQFVILLIASGEVADDLDLVLLDSDLGVVDASLDPESRVEFVMVPEGGSGEYFVVVEAFAGASSYQLLVGEPFADTTATMRLSDPFVPGEAIVKLQDKAVHKRSGLHRYAAEASWTAGRGTEPTPRNIRFDFDQLRLAAPNEPALREAKRVLDKHFDRFNRLGIRYSSWASKLETLYTIKSLRQDPAVASAAPNYLYAPQLTPDDPDYRFQWHYPQIGLPQAWDLSTGAGTTVAVVDTGVLLDHPDLQGQLLPGYDFILNIPGGNDPGQDPPPRGGSSFHGTHVAGTIAAATNNAIHGAGVAFDARIIPLRVCDVFCTSFAIEQAVRYAAGLPNNSGTLPAQPADVINLSLGRGGSPSASEQALYDEVRGAGLVVVAAAGNDDDSNENFPAAYNGVMSVSAVDIQRQKAPYSNFGPWIDVAAPGGDMSRDLNADGHPDGVLSTWGDDRSGDTLFISKIIQGTSMAAPHVAGVVALMRAAEPNLTPNDISNLLINGAMTDDLGTSGRDDIFGHGLINANKAVTAAIDTEGDAVALEPLLTVSPSRLSFGAARQALSVTLANAGGGTITLEQPSEDSGGWLTVSLDSTDGNLIADVTVERAGLPEGLYTARVTFPSSANTVEVRVFMHVADVLDRGIGFQYVLLLDAGSFDVVSEAVVSRQGDSSFDFQFDDVEPGAYLLISGSDSDNDLFICGPGESCGLYRSSGNPTVVEVDDQDLENRDFLSGYDFEFGTSAAQALAGEHGIPRDPDRKLKALSHE